jgi:NTE family protein
LASSYQAQESVGLVLSGGGASGMAHIGVIKALEENDIPIDYIAGSSMGAIIGGLYASGMSIEEMETYFTSDEFYSAISGELDDEFVYYFKAEDPDASMVNMKIDPDTVLLRTIPSYVVSPVQMDMELLESVSKSIATAGYDFDDLMIPFRCVAADIVRKEQVIFKGGELHKALRASSSFPFYFKPLSIDGRLLFDGGLYNNFPLDVMYNEFHPDVILGSSVSLETPPPSPDDLFSQIENMIVNRGSEELPCSEGMVIRPATGVGTLDFKRTEEAILAGYEETLANMDSIRSMLDRRYSLIERELDRRLFRSENKEYLLGEVTMKGISPATTRYFEKVLRLQSDKRPKTLEELKPLYYRVFGDEKINYVFPTIQYNDTTERYDLTLNLEKEKKLFIDFGGNFSSRPVNTGFVGLRYNILGATPKTFYANSYFGKFYNSLLGKARIDIPGRNPYFISVTGMLQQWDYFESFATFFQETRPSYILEYERMAALDIGRPLSNRAKLTADFKYGYDEDDYYLTDDFTNVDTSDVTLFEYVTTGLSYERKTLNRKLYPNDGTFLSVKARYVNGREVTTPGSTGILTERERIDHDWLTFRLSYENYFKTIGDLNLGLQLDAAYSTQDFFANYQATLLSAPYFQPIPESKTLFQNEFRAHTFGAAGLKLVYALTESIDLRFENYLFQPKNEILTGEDLRAEYSEDWLRRFYIGSGSAVYHSPVGPVSFSVNYYDQREEPWSWILNFGYLIFNQRPQE